MCLGHVVKGFFSVLVLKENESEGELAFSRLDVLGAILDLKEVQDHSQVLLGFFIIVAINCCVGIVLDHE
jgi:hypothetical protein